LHSDHPDRPAPSAALSSYGDGSALEAADRLTMTGRQRRLNGAMVSIYETAKRELGYNATRSVQMMAMPRVAAPPDGRQQIRALVELTPLQHLPPGQPRGKAMDEVRRGARSVRVHL
jgi:hypothetical protein